MRVSELIADLSRQMAQSGDLEVVVSDMCDNDNEIEIEDVVRLGDGPILIRVSD